MTDIAETVDRLRPYATEPKRSPMSRGVQFPTTHGRVLSLEQELVRTRTALGEALSIIDLLMRNEDNQRREVFTTEDSATNQPLAFGPEDLA